MTAHFTYHVPTEFETILIASGHLVRLDLRTAAEPGIVIRIHQESPHYPDGNPIKTKPILELLDPDPVVTDATDQSRAMDESTLSSRDGAMFVVDVATRYRWDSVMCWWNWLVNCVQMPPLNKSRLSMHSNGVANSVESN